MLLHWKAWSNRVPNKVSLAAEYWLLSSLLDSLASTAVKALRRTSESRSRREQARLHFAGAFVWNSGSILQEQLVFLDLSWMQVIHQISSR